jgi:hypothetical protein
MTVKFEWKKWMSFAIMAITFFTASYLMAATMPDCTNCSRGESSAMQLFHSVFMFIFGAGSVSMTIGSTLSWLDDQ